MFDSLKGKFKNLFKKDGADEKAGRPERPKDDPPKDKKPKKEVTVDPYDDDEFEFGDDLVEDGEFEDDDLEDDLDDIGSEDVVVEEPPKKEVPVAVPAPKMEAPAPKVEVPATVVQKPKEIPEDDEDDFEFGDDLVEDDGFEDEFEDDLEEDDVVEEPPRKEVPATVPAPKRDVPAPAVPERPAARADSADESKLSKKERIKLAKQAAKEKKVAAKQERIAAKEERIAAKEAERQREKAPGDNELVGDHGKRIKDRNLDGLLWELEVALMEADVALPVVEEIMKGVKDDLSGKRYARGHSLEEVVELSVKDSISKILKINEFDFDAWLNTRPKPAVIMFVGINGTGKTTAIAKIANRLIKKDKAIVLAAADTFRAGAIEQLTIHSERLGCKIVKHAADADPAAVAYDAIEHAKAKHKDVVLVDTAGRMQTNSNLMDEMKKIKRVAKPDLVMFVGDSLAGNDAVEQARAFDAAIGVDAIMLTKIDADSKGGAALSIAHTIGKPIAFVSNGQEYDQIVKFNAKWMMDRLFED